jgi:hypothetical protein
MWSVAQAMSSNDPNTAVEQFATPEPIPANLDAIVKWLGL